MPDPDKPEITSYKHQILNKIKNQLFGPRIGHWDLEFDNLEKSRTNDWIPAFAGMTVFVSV